MMINVAVEIGKKRNIGQNVVIGDQRCAGLCTCAGKPGKNFRIGVRVRSSNTNSGWNCYL